MWREAAGQVSSEAEFSEPVGPAALAEAERRLGCALPAELASLLQETDGIVGAYGVDIIWPLKRIVTDNMRFWSDSSLADLYMPFEAFLFFGDNGGGDQFALARAARRLRVAARGRQPPVGGSGSAGLP